LWFRRLRKKAEETGKKQKLRSAVSGSSATFESYTMGDSREVMNIRQASQYLGVSADTLYKYVSEGRIPAFKLGNRWRFMKALLDGWMAQQSNPGPETGEKKKARARAVGQ
jgi:excisionase family DNA binding protein